MYCYYRALIKRKGVKRHFRDEFGKARLLMNYSATYLKQERSKLIKVFVMFLAVLMTFVIVTDGLTAEAAAAKLATPKMVEQVNYGSDFTHPYNKQTSTIKVHWTSVKGATSYELYIKGGKYKSWKKYKTVKATNCTVSNLARTTTYQFKVRAVKGKTLSAYSKTQTIKTARMDFDKAGWEAMCRIVYHEVGQMSGSMWDKPIVYVADCVANQYVAAKYTNNPMWKAYYRNYKNVQDIIYRSGGFMSSAQLSRDGANYSNVSRRVKQAVFGAVYGKTHYNGIANDYNVYFWCNRSYKTNSSKIAYTFKIPWGYFNVWRTYWG